VDPSLPRLQRAAAGLSRGELGHLSYRMKTHRVFRCKQRRRNRKLAKGYPVGMNLAHVPGRGIARSVACGFATGTSPIRIGIRAPAINDTASEFDARSIRTPQTVGRLGDGIGRESIPRQLTLWRVLASSFSVNLRQPLSASWELPVSPGYGAGLPSFLIAPSVALGLDFLFQILAENRTGQGVV
jgi:hypothetical protein